MVGRWRKGPTGKILKRYGSIVLADTCCCGIECCGRSLPSTLYAEVTIDSDCACAPGYPTFTVPLVYGSKPAELSEQCYEWFGSVEMCTTGGNLQSLWIGLCCRGEQLADDLTLSLGGCSSGAIGVTPDFDPAATCDPLFLSFTDDDGTGGFDIFTCCDPDGTGLGKILSVIITETP